MAASVSPAIQARYREAFRAYARISDPDEALVMSARRPLIAGCLGNGPVIEGSFFNCYFFPRNSRRERNRMIAQERAWSVNGSVLSALKVPSRFSKISFKNVEIQEPKKVQRFLKPLSGEPPPRRPLAPQLLSLIPPQLLLKSALPSISTNQWAPQSILAITSGSATEAIVFLGSLLAQSAELPLFVIGAPQYDSRHPAAAIFSRTSIISGIKHAIKGLPPEQGRCVHFIGVAPVQEYAIREPAYGGVHYDFHRPIPPFDVPQLMALSCLLEPAAVVMGGSFNQAYLSHVASALQRQLLLWVKPRDLQPKRAAVQVPESTAAPCPPPPGLCGALRSGMTVPIAQSRGAVLPPLQAMPQTNSDPLLSWLSGEHASGESPPGLSPELAEELLAAASVTGAVAPHYHVALTVFNAERSNVELSPQRWRSLVMMDAIPSTVDPERAPPPPPDLVRWGVISPIDLAMWTVDTAHFIGGTPALRKLYQMVGRYAVLPHGLLARTIEALNAMNEEAFNTITPELTE